jgi:hypothetical protein
MRITKRQLRKIIRESIEDEKCAIPGNMWKTRNEIDPATGVTKEQQYGDDCRRFRAILQDMLDAEDLRNLITLKAYIRALSHADREAKKAMSTSGVVWPPRR